MQDGQKVHAAWIGVMPPGANTTSTCVGAPVDDEHTINIGIPTGLYSKFSVTATFTLAYTGATDGIITVVTPDGAALSGDAGSVNAGETVKLLNPKAGAYKVLVCAWAGVVQVYNGTLDLETSLIGECPPDLLDGIDLQNVTIPELDAAMEAGSLTSHQLVAAYLKRIATYDPKLDAIRALNPKALDEADRLDAERARSGPRGPLHGIPVLLKDNVGTIDMPTTAGSIALEGSVPRHDATLTDRLRAAGAIILGKTNLSEFANWVDPSMPSGYSSLGGQVRNAYHFGDPSGSSSGSGVAASMAFAAATIGTETSGSILSPSVANSDVGIKTTVGLVSRFGVIPLSGTFDTPGPITRSVTDAAIVLGAIAGADSHDPKTADNAGKIPAGSDYRPFLRADGLRGARIGVSDSDISGLGPAGQKLFNAVIAKMEALGATIVHNDQIANTRNVGLVELGVIPNEFKFGLNKYLAEETVPTLRVRTMTDVVLYNNNHPDKMKYGQTYIIASDATLGNVDEPSALAARTATITASQTVVNNAMSADNLDAIMAPGAINANIGAAALYPSIAVQAGYIAGNQPFGITLLGQAYSEPKLIKFAYAYEHASDLRIRPTLLNKGVCPPKATTAVLGIHRSRVARGQTSLPATGVPTEWPEVAMLIAGATSLGVWTRRAAAR